MDPGFKLIEDVLALFLAKTGVAEFFIGKEDAAQGMHDTAALGFRGMCGNYRNIGQLVEQGLYLFGAHAHALEVGQCRVERTAPQFAFFLTHHAPALLQL